MSDLEKIIETQAREIERLRGALVAEREENLWSAYATGDVRGDEWTHLYMSDGEWLVRQCGLDPKQGYYKAEQIRNAIPIAARAALAGESHDNTIKCGTECPYSHDGFHHVDTSMESGPNNCFHCERPMP